jgi:hypothetical protein
MLLPVSFIPSNYRDVAGSEPLTGAEIPAFPTVLTIGTRAWANC